MKKTLGFAFVVALSGRVASTTPVFADSDLAPLTVAVHDNESGATIHMACKIVKVTAEYEKSRDSNFK